MPTFSQSVIRYPVSGATLADVVAAVSHLPEAGTCSWTPTYTSQIDAHGNVTSAAITCPFEIRLPQWSDYSQASDRAKAEWDRWLGALEAHEHGHMHETMHVFAGTEADMAGKSKHDADAVFNAAVAAAQAASNTFDANTNHGLNNGTVMDTSIV